MRCEEMLRETVSRVSVGEREKGIDFGRIKE